MLMEKILTVGIKNGLSQGDIKIKLGASLYEMVFNECSELTFSDLITCFYKLDFKESLAEMLS